MMVSENAPRPFRLCSLAGKGDRGGKDFHCQCRFILSNASKTSVLPERIFMTDYERLFNNIDDDEVIQVTRDMVEIPSITHHEGMGMVRYLKRWFKDLKIPIRIYPMDHERANFFADYGAVAGPGCFMFNGHQDTKPMKGMTVDPFAGDIKDGMMYGRGTCDMKGGIAGVLCAFKALVRAEE